MLPSRLPELVSADESLARFLTSSNHFNTKGVKAAAFSLSREQQETSVFRHDGNPSDELWAIGDAHLGRAYHGAAIMKVRDVKAASLDVSADEPPPRHAVIKGWPWLDDDRLRKARQMEVALQVASNAALLLKTPAQPSNV
jgi:hypothetical protein